MICRNTGARQRWLACGLVAVTAALAGCSHDVNDLQDYVRQVEARKAPAVKPIPQIKPYETYTYQDDNLRSPFQPPAQQAHDSNVRPDTHRNKEYLEQFPLDGLKMVGTIRMNDTRYALIRDSAGIVHQVKRGNYMGQNDGRIVKIDASGMTLREIVPNGLGGYVKRETNILLAGAGPKAGNS